MERMQINRNARSWLQRLARGVVLWVSAAVLGYLGVGSLLITSVKTKFSDERIYMQPDQPLLRLILLVVLAAVLAGAASLLVRDSSKAQRRLDLGCAAVCLWCLGLGLWWGSQSAFMPSGTDMYKVWQAALSLTQNDYDFLGYWYFQRYPFQVGTALYFEAVFRLFSTTSIWAVVLTNSLWLGLSVFCGYKIIGIMSGGSPCLQGVFLALAAGCVQPMLLSPFFYGDIPSIGCSFLAVFWGMRFYTSQKLRYILGAAAALVGGVLVRNTVLITALAVALVQLVSRIGSTSQCPAPYRSRAKTTLGGHRDAFGAVCLPLFQQAAQPVYPVPRRGKPFAGFSKIQLAGDGRQGRHPRLRMV